METTKNTASAHTPVPWKVVGTEIWSEKHDGVCGKVLGSVGGSYSEKDRAVRQANAAFVVLACNTHEELLDCARALYDLTSNLREDGCDLFDDHAPLLDHCYQVLCKQDRLFPEKRDHGQAA